MPPESLPWDRKDLSKERKKRERSSDPIRPVSKWREAPHHDSSSPRDYNRRGVCGFRRRPPGYGKLDGWHNYPGQSGEKIEDGHGEQGGCHHYVDQSGCGQSSSEKIVDGETGRPFGSRVDGRCIGNSRESRLFFRQKDWERHPLENGESTEGSGRPLNHSAQRSSVHAREQFHSKDQLNKIENVSELGMGLRSESGCLLGSTDWKAHKWTRSGVMSARSSGFTRPSFSKIPGADSSEAKSEVQKCVNPIESHSEDVADRAQSAALSEETSSRKKPRVRWGEGLAKFERKNVDVPTKHGMVDCGRTEASSSDFPNSADKSPRHAVFSKFASPATPSSIPCCSSPGMVEKGFLVSSTTDTVTCKGSGSSDLHSKDHVEDIDLDSLDTTSVAKLSSLLSKLLQFDDPTSEGFGFVRATAMNKLLVWKGRVTKALEMTESEIDSLETELKLLKSDSGSNCHFPSTFSSLTGNSDVETPAVQVVSSNSISQLAGLELVSCGDLIMKEQDNDMQEIPDPLRGKVADSPGTMTSKYTVSLPSMKHDTLSDRVKDSVGSVDLDASTPRIPEQVVPVYSCEAPVLANVHGDREINLYDLITASNKECAERAFNVFKKLLPSDGCTFAISRTSMVSNKSSTTLIKEKIAARKRFLKFKERVLTLKFMVFRHVWKKDIQLLNAREFHEKSQIRLESSIQKLRCSNQKHRSSHRSRLSRGLLGNLNVVPAVDVINFASKLLSDSPFKLHRSALRMPALILNEEKKALQFVSNNGLVQDPCAVEKERALINPWTTEEKDIFMDKLVSFGKYFGKIASFLDYKTTADCIEFYYKNHKSDCFRKTIKKLKFAGQEQSLSAHNYLVTSGKQRNRGANAASLDVLNTTSAVAATAGNGMRSLKNPKPRFSLGVPNNHKASQPDLGTVESLGTFEGLDTDKETVAVSVLAGICGSPSSQAMSSCNLSSFDPVEGYQDSKCQNLVSSIRRPLTPEVAESIDDEISSDESSDEMYHADWTDDEKSVFIQAVKAYGTDFAIISQRVRTKSETQCKVFFSKARDCLGLDMIGQRSVDDRVLAGDGYDYGGSMSDYASGLLNDPLICSEKSESKLDDSLSLGRKVDMEMKYSSKVEKGAISLSNMDELLKSGPELDEHMVDSNLKACESYPADTKSLLSINSAAAYDTNKHQSELAVSGPAKSCPVLAAHLTPMATGNKMYGDVCSKKQASLQTHSKMIWDAHSGKNVLKPCGLHKCSSASNSSLSVFPCLSIDNRSNRGHTDSFCSLDLVKPCKNSEVKLFGKILTGTSTQQNHSIGGVCKNNEKASHLPDLNPVPPKFDGDNYMGVVKVSDRSNSFLEGKRTQTGVSSLPESKSDGEYLSRKFLKYSEGEGDR